MKRLMQRLTKGLLNRPTNRPTTRLALVALLGAAAAGAGATGAAAQFDKPEDAVRYRQAAYTLIGEQMGRIHGELQASRPDTQRIRASADFIALVATAPWETFTPDTAKVKGSSARPASVSAAPRPVR